MNFKGFGTEPPANGGGGRPPANSLLARQSSIYSLTFDELQNTMGGSLGKDFGSMNMDELLKNIWSAEEVQSMAGVGATTAAVIGAPSVSTAQIAGVPAAAPLQRQGSLTLPRTLSQKTVDEVWKSLSKDGNGGAIAPAVPPRQQTLGEITLEEFLVRAGVVREDNNIDNNNAQFNSNSKPPNGTTLFSTNNHNNNNTNLGMISGIMSSSLNPAPIPIQAANLPLNVNGVRSATTNHHHQQPQQIFPKQSQVVAYGAGPQLGSPAGVMGLGSPGNQISSDGVRSNGDTSSVSPVPFVFNGGLRGRKGGGAVEKVVERRQRRMIKNRESAARSRARKQVLRSCKDPVYYKAYTMELEVEVAKLKEENEELRKKQEHMIEMQKNQAKELMNAQKGGKKRCLRRTQTGPW